MDAIAPRTPAPSSSIDTGTLKKFAQEARRALREQVTSKLDHVLPGIARRGARPRRREGARKRDPATSRDSVIERIAYTWFNRFSAFRFMDANGLTGVGVLSPREGETRPEILSEAMAGVIGATYRPRPPKRSERCSTGARPRAIRRAKPTVSSSSRPATTGMGTCRSCSSRSPTRPNF